MNMIIKETLTIWLALVRNINAKIYNKKIV